MLQGLAHIPSHVRAGLGGAESGVQLISPQHSAMAALQLVLPCLRVGPPLPDPLLQFQLSQPLFSVLGQATRTLALQAQRFLGLVDDFPTSHLLWSLWNPTLQTVALYIFKLLFIRGSNPGCPATKMHPQPFKISFLEIGSYKVAQAGLELLILLASVAARVTGGHRRGRQLFCGTSQLLSYFPVTLYPVGVFTFAPSCLV